MVTKLITFLTMEEVNRLIKEAKTKELKLAISLGAGSGLRISEIVGGKRKKDNTNIPPLTSDMVDLVTHQIRVVQGKGKKDRITVTSPWLNKTNISALPIILPQRTLQYQFTSLCKRVLKKSCNFHMLRHSFGNFMVNEKNVPLPQVQALMGHSRIDTTGIYTKANPVQAIGRAWEAFG
jgi:integrase/recombinase XerD